MKTWSVYLKFDGLKSFEVIRFQRVLNKLGQTRTTCSCGSISGKKQGGHSAVPFLHECPRDWPTAETDGFVQDGGLHL